MLKHYLNIQKRTRHDTCIVFYYYGNYYMLVTNRVKQTIIAYSRMMSSVAGQSARHPVHRAYPYEAQFRERSQRRLVCGQYARVWVDVLVEQDLAQRSGDHRRVPFLPVLLQRVQHPQTSEVLHGVPCHQCVVLVREQSYSLVEDDRVPDEFFAACTRV